MLTMHVVGYRTSKKHAPLDLLIVMLTLFYSILGEILTADKAASTHIVVNTDSSVSY